MLSSGKPSFLFYGHSDIKEWIEVLTPNSQDCGENAKIEMENLKDYLDQYNSLSGLVLQKLSIQVIIIIFLSKCFKVKFVYIFLLRLNYIVNNGTQFLRG